jgi:hypothetical protein
VIYIRAEIWPKGDRKRARILAEATIENRGGTQSRGNYLARLSNRSGFKSSKGLYSDPELTRVCAPRASSVWKAVEIVNFPRLNLGVWDLLFRVLRACVGSRNSSL